MSPAASGYEIFHSESGKEGLAFVKEHKAPGISEVSMLPTDLTYRYSGEELKLYLQRISSIGIIQIVGIYSFTGQPS